MLTASLKWMGAALLVAFLVVGTGCSNRHKTVDEDETGAGGFATGVGTGEAGVMGDITEMDVPPADRMNIEGEPRPVSELVAVYFDYNQYNLTPEAVQSLERNLEWIQAHPNRPVRIEGNCDERGSEQYNLALGEKRAAAIRNYLYTRGANPEMLHTISFGESNPVVAGSGEAAWRQNRRGEFKAW